MYWSQLYSSVLNAEKKAVEERLQAKSQQLKYMDQTDVSELNLDYFALTYLIILWSIGKCANVDLHYEYFKLPR